ncbi:MAG: hypothetical protein H7211_02145 [Aquabacterium sp.]|nr:hypothetical protein [Ferruginibacter sp.]
MREGLKWKAHSHEVRVARTWNVKPDPPAGGARPKHSITFYFKQCSRNIFLLQLIMQHENQDALMF